MEYAMTGNRDFAFFAINIKLYFVALDGLLSVEPCFRIGVE